jgi:hypothetical protein
MEAHLTAAYTDYEVGVSNSRRPPGSLAVGAYTCENRGQLRSGRPQAEPTAAGF